MAMMPQPYDDDYSVNHVPRKLEGLLEGMSADDLKQLLNEKTPAVEAKIQEIINGLDEVKELDKKKETALAMCKGHAEWTLSKEDEYNRLRQELCDSHRETIDLKREVEKKKEKIDEYGRQTSLEITLALLQTATAEAEEEAESLASSMFSGDMRVDDFIKQFIDKRKLAHIRRIKTEKLMDHVRR
ncbi:vacuolar protein sorting 37B [Brevipalpus obovatus]|uniref:vacuolar protein sorting 37B n=1 Tax=Brevipalpus obovatus TaxID=246614 RepID=UPI003D9F4655